MKDLIIIGAGPIGLACGIEAKKNNLDYEIIDKGMLVNSILITLLTQLSFQQRISLKLVKSLSFLIM